MIARGGTDPIMMFDFFIRQPFARILQDYFVKNHYRVRGVGRGGVSISQVMGNVIDMHHAIINALKIAPVNAARPLL
jgi:hypothetical protein